MKTDNDGKMELRQTYWKCTNCKKIFTKADIQDEVIVCPECGLSSSILPITVFEVVDLKKKAVEG